MRNTPTEGIEAIQVRRMPAWEILFESSFPGPLGFALVRHTCLERGQPGRTASKSRPAAHQHATLCDACSVCSLMFLVLVVVRWLFAKFSRVRASSASPSKHDEHHERARLANGMDFRGRKTAQTKTLNLRIDLITLSTFRAAFWCCSRARS